MFPFVDEINPAGWAHLAYFGLLIPLVVLRGRKKIRDPQRPLPNRLRHFQATTLSLVMFAVMSLLVARAEWIELFPRAWPPLSAILAGAVMLVAAVAIMRPRWRRAVEHRTPLGARILHLYMPANAVERAWWIAVAVLAGISEEITWRGVQTALLSNLIGRLWIAAIVCAISFGVAHMIQGWKSSVIVVFFALGFQALVWLSGSLYVAMAVHTAYDIVAGLTYGRLGKEFGYLPEVNEAPNASTS
jgi:membrane protease YdiL (CAAX protease family)